MVKLDHPQRFSYPVALYKIKGEVIYNLLGFLLANQILKHIINVCVLLPNEVPALHSGICQQSVVIEPCYNIPSTPTEVICTSVQMQE